MLVCFAGWLVTETNKAPKNSRKKLIFKIWNEEIHTAKALFQPILLLLVEFIIWIRNFDWLVDDEQQTTKQNN